jgi:hypothetical protein
MTGGGSCAGRGSLGFIVDRVHVDAVAAVVLLDDHGLSSI